MSLNLRRQIDVVFHDDWLEIDRQLWEIDENLMRAELSPTEMGHQGSSVAIAISELHGSPGPD